MEPKLMTAKECISSMDAIRGRMAGRLREKRLFRIKPTAKMGIRWKRRNRRLFRAMERILTAEYVERFTNFQIYGTTHPEAYKP